MRGGWGRSWCSWFVGATLSLGLLALAVLLCASSAHAKVRIKLGTLAPQGSTWHQLLDAGRMQDGEPYLAGTARPVAAKLSAATASAAGVADGDKLTVATAAGSITVPVDVVPMADGVVWLPANSPGSAVRADLGAGHGSRVTLRRAE